MFWNRSERLEELATRIKACKACPLADTRTNVVVCSGNPEARLLLVGEGPGENEDLTGEAFVGDAGDMLDKILARSGFARSDFYIINVVRCRPTDMNGNNRPPSKLEIRCCSQWLVESVYAHDPIVIVAAGKTAANVFGKWKKLGDATKDMFDTFIPGKTTPLTYPVMAVNHPSDLLRRAHHYDVFQSTLDQFKHLRKTVDAFELLGRGKPTIRPVEGQKGETG